VASIQTLGVAFTRNRTATLQPQTAESLNTGERVKLDWQGAVRVSSAQSVLLGLEDARDEISAPLSASVRTASAYVELQSRLGQHWFSALNARYDDNDRFGGKVTYRIAPTWVSSESGTKLKASVAAGSRRRRSVSCSKLSTVLLREPGSQARKQRGLRSRNRNRGWAGAWSGSGPPGSTIAFATYHGRPHWNDVRQRRAGEHGWGRELRGVPAGEAAELAAGTTPIRRRPTTCCMRSCCVARSTRATSMRPGGPSDALLLNASVLTASGWVDGNRDFSIPRLDAPGYTTVNLAASFDVSRQWAVFGRIDNLLDRHYENPVGFLQPGIAVFAGIRTQL